MKKLFTAQSDNDVTRDNLFTTVGRKGGSSPLGFHCYGTFVTATVTVYVSNDPANNGVALPELTFDADGYVNLDLPDEVSVHAELSGATGGESVNLWVAGIGTD